MDRISRVDPSLLSIAKTEERLGQLQGEFNHRKEANGLRAVMVIGNEAGCPFRCKGCGIHESAMIVSEDANKKMIESQTARLSQEAIQNPEQFEAGYNVCIYNSGNITNVVLNEDVSGKTKKHEISKANFDLLLDGLDKIVPPPTHVSINSRGKFINKRLLEYLRKKNLSYNINFIIGVESFTKKGSEIYGKPDIRAEFDQMHKTINRFNTVNKTLFGIDAGFVFLPEFYSDDRKNTAEIRDGFKKELLDFVNLYTPRQNGDKINNNQTIENNVPVKINIHPYYVMKGKENEFPYNSAADAFGILIEVLEEVQKEIDKRNDGLPIDQRTTLFIGVNDEGYNTEEWQKTLSEYKDRINIINKG